MLTASERAFLDAAHGGDVEKIRELLAAGVSVDVREDACKHFLQNEQTALMYAAAQGHLEIVRMLLKAGADVKATDKSRHGEDIGEQTALHYAARQPNAAIVEELLNAGAGIDALARNKPNKEGYTALCHALEFGQRDNVQLLIRRGANLGSTIGRRTAVSPLCAAAGSLSRNSAETVRDFIVLLLEAGADPNGVGGANQTALFSLASRSTDIKATVLPEEMTNLLVEKLLKAGAKPDWPDKFGSVVLETALIYQKTGVVKLLLEAGADVNRVFQRGTALDIIERDLANAEKSLAEAKGAPKPADAKGAERQQRLRAVIEEKVHRCKEIREVLGKSGAKRKSELPASS